MNLTNGAIRAFRLGVRQESRQEKDGGQEFGSAHDPCDLEGKEINHNCKRRGRGRRCDTPAHCVSTEVLRPKANRGKKKKNLDRIYNRFMTASVSDANYTSISYT